MAITIKTSQAPAAKPVPASVRIGTDWTTLLEVPEYDIPVIGLGADRRIAPALIEIASPLIAACISQPDALLDIRIQRANFQEVTLAVQTQVFLGDPKLVPLNGTMLTSGDKLQVKANLADEVDVTISATVGQAEEDDVAL